ncbi:RING-type E3 ubiquitin transferase itt1 [Hyphodiscus hymeniophilus]|uniref:RBR-type E3 ubiquitin transferase n=1 Tax=Hyphodiscus hymeniophilus TaxID=353542 RepID=A0A9P6VL95_9HELO|nr:RING-type E3 ubiquitin transferase itt1 [Hyphodiscus hymeniophilus]
MARERVEGASHEERRTRRRRKSNSELDKGKIYESSGKEEIELEPDASEVRRLRLERLEGSTSTRRSVATPKMTSESHTTLASLKSASSHRTKHDSRRSTVSTKHRTKRKSTSREEMTPTYVYGTPADISQSSHPTISETRKLGRNGESSDSENEEEERAEKTKEKPKKKKTRVIYIEGEESKSSRHRERRVKSDEEVRDHPRHPHESVRRSRVHTTRRKSIVGEGPAPLPTRRSSFLGSFFGPAAQHHHEPEKLVECLTCLSDDIPRSKSAKLKCGHRMCHSCLKRIFKLSVTDPQHMPPKCCTADHIPLKHVERLFDNKFKKNWNLKFAEYSTKNRIYCPARRCGEWIKPGNIHKEDGKKFGKCSRCKTKVCCLCNGKWHGTKDCPKDEETNRLLEAAKEAGWQRCYNCRTMVELKEGCNHMTCRCTAEFCMICGLKWKSCNCPWFNYDAVEADRLNNMQIPMPAEPERPNRLRRPRPNNYGDEMDQRRRQERADEELARRLQRVAIDDGENDYQGGIGDIHGIGNGAGHFMNQDYIRAAHNILTGAYGEATAAANYVMGVAAARGAPPSGAGLRRMNDRYPAPQAARPPSPPLLRRHTAREQAYNAAPTTRASERVVPRRMRTDYAAEAAVHAPLGRGHQRTASAQELPTPRPSVLAGLGGVRRGGNRVDAWRTHVEPGVTPAEGVLSM